MSKIGFEERFAVLMSHIATVTKSTTYPDRQITPVAGRKYIKLVDHRRGLKDTDRSVYGFVNPETGDILKAESWAKPHPTPRGNVFDDDYGKKAVTQYGFIYLKR